MDANRSILVVEDDQEINQLVGAYAQIAGFEYRAALNGTAALIAAHNSPPAAVILDLMLPDIDGLEICKRLKSAPDTRSVPIIILSALGSEKDVQRGRDSGAADYLIKPFDPDRLLAALAQHASSPAA